MMIAGDEDDGSGGEGSGSSGSLSGWWGSKRSSSFSKRGGNQCKDDWNLQARCEQTSLLIPAHYLPCQAGEGKKKSHRVLKERRKSPLCGDHH